MPHSTRWMSGSQSSGSRGGQLQGFLGFTEAKNQILALQTLQATLGAVEGLRTKGEKGMGKKSQLFLC